MHVKMGFHDGDEAGSPGPRRLEVRTPAKINLSLEVLERLENGYHGIRSLVVPISIFDRLVLEETDGAIETVVTSNGDEATRRLADLTSSDNLATRAAELLKHHTGYPGGVRIALEKRIPVGGGLGGGSADAAGTLVGLAQLWNLDVSLGSLMDLSAGVGCDVPALVHGGAVCVEGMGERVTGVEQVIGRAADDPKGWWLVLVNPRFAVSTADIYGRCKPPLTSGPIHFKYIVSAYQNGDAERAGEFLFNGLQDLVFRKYPLIEMVAEGLDSVGALGVLLCGSGASVFGLARDEAHAVRMAEQVPTLLRFPVWTKVARTLPDGVMVAHGPLEARV